MILPYNFEPTNITKSASLEPLGEDIIDFTFVPKESGSFSGFIKIEYENREYVSDFAIQVYTTERFIEYVVKNYWWLFDTIIIIFVLIFIYLTKNKFKKKEKVEYV